MCSSTFLDEMGRPSFQALQHRSVKRSAVVFYAFDLLQLGRIDYRSKPLRDRRRVLAGLKFGAPILLSAPLPGTPDRIERVVRDAGLEGVVAKRLDSIYESGLRSRSWIKVRFNQRQEFVIGGYKPAGRSFDSVLVGYYEGARFTTRPRSAPASRPRRGRQSGVDSTAHKPRSARSSTCRIAKGKATGAKASP